MALTSSPPVKTLRPLAYAIPFALMAAITAVYAASPEFYLEYVLLEEARELQAVEIITFASAALAAILLFYAAWRVWRMQSHGVPAGLRGRLAGASGALIIATIGLAALFFAGEEISWGQSYFGWETPRKYRDISHETNIHNSWLPVQSMGSAFIIVMFFALPALWASRARIPLPLPRSWRPAIAEGPVITTMAFAFIWKFGKEIYKLIVNPDTDEPGNYNDFIEQFNEHKEMLIAVGLLLYAVYRVRAAHRVAPGRRI